MFIRPASGWSPTTPRSAFMRGRRMGLIVSAVLSACLRGAVLLSGPEPRHRFLRRHRDGDAHAGAGRLPRIRAALAQLNLGPVQLQQFGEPTEVLIRFGASPPTRRTAAGGHGGARQAGGRSSPAPRCCAPNAVGASVCGELFRNGLLALGIAAIAMLIYIWFRFEWQFGVGAVVTILLDMTKAIGFLAMTRIEFDLAMAAILTIIGYSINDKVVVYDRVRENLRKYKMPLRDLIDLSINETLNRTLGTSMTMFLASLPLALFGGESFRLRDGDAVRRRRHLVVDLHRSAYPVVSRRTPPAPRRAG